MKKVLVFLLVLTLTLSMSLSAMAASDKSNNGNGNGNSSSKSSTQSDMDLLKQFKQEMNEAKKNLVVSLQAARNNLQTQYDALLLTEVPVDPTEAQLREENLATLLVQISDADAKLANPEAAMKQIINERYMVIKSLKSGFNLADYEKAEDLIAAMYVNAQNADAWSLSVKNNLLKLEGPSYLKGSKIMFPVRALEASGADVDWNEENDTVTILKSGVQVVFTMGSTIVSVLAPAPETLPEEIAVIEGTETDDTAVIDTGEVTPADASTTVEPLADIIIEMDEPALLNCGRAYVPLKYLEAIFAMGFTYDEVAATLPAEEPATDAGTLTDTTGDAGEITAVI